MKALLSSDSLTITISSNLKANEQIQRENFGKTQADHLCHNTATSGRLSVTLKYAGLFLPGTASVIIALTDGELLEDQLITAQQEVHTNSLNCHSFSLNNTP